jgi:hypothetical protein
VVVANARKAFRGCAVPPEKKRAAQHDRKPNGAGSGDRQWQSAAIAPGGDLVVLFEHPQRGVGVLLADVQSKSRLGR